MWGSNTTTLLCSSSGSPVDKAHPLECRSRTPRNTDGLVRLSALPLNDLRVRLNKRSYLHVYEQTGMCTGFVLLGCECICGSVFTHFDAVHVYSTAVPLFTAFFLFASCLQASVYIFIHLEDFVYTYKCVCVCKQNTSESIHLESRPRCAVAAE